MGLAYNHMTWNTEEKEPKIDGWRTRTTTTKNVYAASAEPAEEGGGTETHERDTGTDSENSVEGLENTEPEEWTQDTGPTEYKIQEPMVGADRI